MGIPNCLITIPCILLAHRLRQSEVFQMNDSYESDLLDLFNDALGG